MGESVAGIAVGVWLLALAGVDARTAQLPNRWTVPALVAVLMSGLGGLVCGDPAVVVAATVTAMPYLLAFVAGQCGAGDVKCAYVLGGLSGDLVTGLAVVVLAQLNVIIWQTRSRIPHRLPHGPMMTCAAVIVLGG
ncbi:prepilin peptidase [Gordonia sp. CPCC 205333]|uniref:prepilin peptidase n=1 Tax=Gordonia sp. CPCC 205333 TaxID=3140790 RepID=UPI003AF38608